MLVREAKWPSDKRQSLSEDCYSLRLSLLSCPPNHYQDLSWISLRLVLVKVCFYVGVCVSPLVLSPCLLSFLSLSLSPFAPPLSLSGSKLVHLQKIPTTLTLIQLKASGYAKNMSSHRLLHIMIIDRPGLTEAGILHTSAVHNWSDNSRWTVAAQTASWDVANICQSNSSQIR